MRRSPLLFLLATAALTLAPASLAAQKPPKTKPKPPSTTLPAILTAFLADSGVQTRGLPWTTGNALPIKWKSVAPVPSQYTMYPGVTSERTGTARMSTDTGTISVNLAALGNADGIQRFWVSWDMVALPTLTADSLLLKAGFTLKPSLCSRDKEGYSYGNLLQVIKAPGKKAAGLHEEWNCAQEDCVATFVLYYRKADQEKVECATG